MLGIIGLGGIFRDAYRESFAYLNKSDVLVYDISEEAIIEAIEFSKTFCEGYSVAENVSEVFSLADEVILLLPPKSILPVITDGLSNSSKITTKKIYIEKPLGVTAEESRLIKQLLDNYGIILYYNEVFLHSSTTDVIVEEILSNRNGDVVSIEMTFNGGIPQNIQKQWRGDIETGGMVWHDWGIHAIGLLLGILGRLSVNIFQIDVNEIIVSDVIWENISDASILVQSKANFTIQDIEVTVLASWTKTSENEMIIRFENGNCLELNIGKINGVSSWSLYEINGLTRERHFLGASRYPKERFIRSVTAFLQERNLDYLSYELGLKVMEIADNLLRKSF